MYRIPRFWRRFRFMMTLQDILLGRASTISYHDLITDRQKMRLERHPK